MSTFFNDLKYSLRMLGKNPGYALTIVLILALGIGANTALFSVIQSILLNPLPFAQSERLVWLCMQNAKTGSEGSVSPPNFRDWNEQNTMFETMTAIDPEILNLTGQGDPMALKAWHVTKDFFNVFDSPPLLGHGFREAKQENKSQTVVLSHDLWQQLFTSDPNIIGHPITLEGQSYTIIGVARPEMDRFTNAIQAFVPIAERTLNRPRWDSFLRVVGRLKAGMTHEQAQNEMAVISKRLAQQYPEDIRDGIAKYMPLQTFMGRDYSGSLWALYGAVTLLLLLACVNVASLMLVKAGARMPEMAIKQALGAGRWPLICQLLTESVILSLGACILGGCLAYWIVAGIKLIAPHVVTHRWMLPNFAEIGLDAKVGVFTVLLSALTAIGVGLIPALHAGRAQAYQVMRAASHRVSSYRSRLKVLQGFVIGEISLALILLVGAALLIQSMARVQQINPGFQAEGVLTARMKLPDTQAFRHTGDRTTFYMEVVRRLERLPGIQSAAVINNIPLQSPSSGQGFKLEIDPSRQMRGAWYRHVSPNYFETMQIPLLRGRAFTPSDIESNNDVMIVSQDFVKKFLPDVDPIGQRILHWGETPKEIIGVVGNVKMEQIHDRELQTAMYEPIDQECWRTMALVVRTSAHPMAWAETVRQEIQAVSPDQPVLRFDSMAQLLANATALDRFSTFLLGCMGAVALLLALIGIFGVTAYTVNERTHEIGIRAALGAEVSDILILFLRKGLVLISVGTVVGLLGALALSRFMSGLLYEVKATDPLTFIIVTAIMEITALCACTIPAHRAAKTDPMEALRYE
jgi:putative ABC transport system permease protein